MTGRPTTPAHGGRRPTRARDRARGRDKRGRRHPEGAAQRPFGAATGLERGETCARGTVTARARSGQRGMRLGRVVARAGADRMAQKLPSGQAHQAAPPRPRSGRCRGGPERAARGVNRGGPGWFRSQRWRARAAKTAPVNPDFVDNNRVIHFSVVRYVMNLCFLLATSVS